MMSDHMPYLNGVCYDAISQVTVYVDWSMELINLAPIYLRTETAYLVQFVNRVRVF